MINLSDYMSESIRSIVGRVYLNVLSNPREAAFVLRMQQRFSKSERRRAELKEKEGIDVPPFLIASIATTCNLHCKGCYARKNGIASDLGHSKRATLAPEQWRDIFGQAAEMGVNFALLAGGEPLTRRDLLEKIAEVKDMVFPIFTNGTMIGERYVDFFQKHLNMIPVISLEGDATTTDARRGKGVYELAEAAMGRLKEARLLFGTSITVTTENYERVTSEEYITQLHDMGCRIIFYVEYVPIEKGTAHLAFGDEEVMRMEQILEERRETTAKDLVLLSFPGDEKAVGGCLAAGRGFFHINSDGSAEPCPFSPHSDSNVVEIGLKEALNSPLFRRIRDARALGWEHTGGCTLFEHEEEVAAMARE
ncbi:MAG: radical SAM protein [Bacteroidales bacterium]|nr:radical SAM protein [Bacteroidales bacterium]